MKSPPDIAYVVFDGNGAFIAFFTHREGAQRLVDARFPKFQSYILVYKRSYDE